MSEPLGTLSPLLVSALAATVPLADVQVLLPSLPAWAATLGLVGVTLGDILGRSDGDGDDEDAADGDVTPDGGEDDFLDGGDFGGGGDDQDGFDDGLGSDDDDSLAEIEPRLSDLEAEIDDLSATVSSVSAENESMRESVETIEGNVRKLLEVYEIVTQGANPFADADSFAPTGESAFNLLGEDDEPATEPTDGEDLFDGEEEPAGEGAFEPAEDADGVSFDELKSEFEHVEEEAEPDPALDDVTVEDEPGGGDVEGSESAPSTAEADRSDGKPYLGELPGGYGAELVVMEWLDHLVGETSVGDATRAVRFYRTVDWIAEPVASDLRRTVEGMAQGGDRATADGGRPSQLSIEHHARSLEYISQLAALRDGTHPPDGVPDGTLDGIRFGSEDHGVQR